MRYTDEELSRILGEHEAGNLMANGAENWGVASQGARYPQGCANQVAYNEDGATAAWRLNRDMAGVFDRTYKPLTGPLSVDDLLAALDRDP